jgi:hypothetical protein
MPTTNPRPKRIRADYRRALTVLADSPDGATEALMLARGFKLELLVELCRGGLASAQSQRVRAGREMEVTKVKITEAGRRALASETGRK